MRRQFSGMPLQFREVVEGISSVQLTGVNQTHEQITGMRSVQRLVEKRIPAIEDRFLQSTLDDVVIDGCPWLRKEERQLRPVFQEIGDGFSQPGIGLDLVLRQLCFHPLPKFFHHRPTMFLMEAQPFFR
jgi:hypothetical protein